MSTKGAGRMSDLKVREKAEEVFREALALTGSAPALRDLHGVLRECRAQLDEPMRVAIVGFIKAGKSTMMNALLGEAVVATGTVEATFNVNWLKWGEEKSLLVRFKDGSPPERKSIEELEALTRRADENRDYLLSIRHIEVLYPNRMLQTFNLIDTPGLASFYKDDSQNTLDFLKLHGDELTEATRAEASQADAVLYLFSGSVRMEDQSIIEQFHGDRMGNPTPINAIGVLTKVDFYWPDREDPLEAGEVIARRLREDAKVRRLFYTVYPISGLLAVGAQTLKPKEFETLTRLAALPQDRFERLARNVHKFTREYPDVPVAPVERQHVLDRLGLYGVTLACGLIRGGDVAQDVVVEKMLRQSGLPQLRDLVTSHFGNRAFLIKLGTVLKRIESVCFREQRRLKGEGREAVEEVAGRFDQLVTDEHAFQELRVLRNHYEGRIEFSEDEVQQLLEVTGEYGTSLGERLGLGERATVEEILRVAQERMWYWHRKASDFSPVNRETIDATHVLARSFERILFYAKKAQYYLYV